MRFILITIAFIFCTAFSIGQIRYSGKVSSNNKNAYQVKIAKDNLYAYAIADREIQTYSRDPVSGQLTYLSSITISSDGSQLQGISTLCISPDDRFIYTKGSFKAFVFQRDTLNGALTPFQTLTDGYYGSGLANISTNNIATTKNGKHVYITSTYDLYIYTRTSSDQLILTDTMERINYSGLSSDISIAISKDDERAYITGGDGISVYAIDPVSGVLNRKSMITGGNFINKGLAYAFESVVSKDDRFLYTATVAQGTGALVVLERDTATDSLSVIQTIYNNIKPHYISLSHNGRLLCISSGVTGSGTLTFFETNLSSGRVRELSSYQGAQYFGKKLFDPRDDYFYTPLAFTDTIYTYKLKALLDTVKHICTGDSILLNSWKSFYSHQWSTGSTDPEIWAKDDDMYILHATDSTGHSLTDTIHVNVHQLPTVNIGNDTTLYVGEDITLYTGINYSSWEWNINNINSPYLYLLNDSTYFGTMPVSVKVTDSYGCASADTVLITFSPSGLSIPESDNLSIMVYPNPADSEIIICIPNNFENTDVTLLNIFGEPLKHATGDSAQLVIRCEDLSSGSYYLSIRQNEKQIAFKKIIITR